MVFNLDQTPLKLVPCCKQALAPKYTYISGSSHKQAIAETLVITSDEKFLPFQLVYGCKTL